MKKILFAAVAAILASCATAPGPAPAAPQTAAPKAAPAAPEAPAAPQPKVVTWQDALPTLVKSSYANGDLAGQVKTKYDDRGYLVLQESSNGNGVLTETRTGKANGAFWRITVTNTQTGDVVKIEDDKFGTSGELLLQNILNAKEVPQVSNEYTYDKAGRRILLVTRSGSGELQAKTEYLYDDKGNNFRINLYDAGGSLTNIYNSTFDDQGHILVKKGTDASGNLVEQVNTTWKDGRKVKEETVKPLPRTLEFGYTDQAAPTSITITVRGRVERQTLEYQWITRTRTIAP